MNSIAEKIFIRNTFDNISIYDSNKTSIRNIEAIQNEFLDKVLNIQSTIRSRSEYIENIIETFERITWINIKGRSITDEELKNKYSKEELSEIANMNIEDLIQKLIDVSQKLHKSSTQDYIYLNNNVRQFASKEIQRFKCALDDFKECFEDLSNIFIELPNDNQFTILNDELGNL